MSMLFWYELKKILSGTVLWIFIALCIIFNIWTMPTSSNIEFDTSTPFNTNVFDDFNTSKIADIYITHLGLTGRVAENMSAKYETLQITVDEKALAGDSFSPYFGEHTSYLHLNMFNRLGIMGKLLLQGILLAVLLALLGVGYEQINHTEHNIYATKTGRRILRYKIAVNLTSVIGLYILLTTMTLIIYFAVFDYGNVWDSNISSGFNVLADDFTTRPFTTWQSFTVLSYFLAYLGVSLVLIICFSIMGVIIGTLSKNGYIGFLVVMIVNAICLVLPNIISVNSFGLYILYHMPIWLWWYSGLWFTDGGFITLWKNFELRGTGISFLILTALCILTVKKFEKRDIA